MPKTIMSSRISHREQLSLYTYGRRCNQLDSPSFIVHKSFWACAFLTIINMWTFGSWMSEYCWTSLAETWGRYCALLFWNKFNGIVFKITLHHRQPYTLHVSEQFGALYMHNHNDRHPNRPGYKPSSSESKANQPSLSSVNSRQPFVWWN